MGGIATWLLDDRQKDLFEILVALALNLLFLALAALLLWPLDKLPLVAGLARGYGRLWFAIGAAAVPLHLLQRWFRVNLYDRANAYVVSNLAVSCALQLGWSAFAALTVHGFLAGAPAWTAAVLHLVGALSCLSAFFAVSSVFQGAIYKLISLPVALIGFLAFSLFAP